MNYMAFLFILIVSIPIYMVCKWSLRRLKFGNDKNRKYLAVLPTIVLSPLVYVVIITLWVFSISYYSTIDFDQEIWQSNTEERFKMSKNIIESEILVGKTKEQVIALLGDKYYLNNEDGLTYGLGILPGLLNIDPSFLFIEFENGVVKKVYQYDS
ncbi:hypothetical protein AWW67_06415 [Roseivirga seohaensis]|uniref:Uncharacterized protein n=2 Tax=Roseivirga seohaensis TaxID=1914963 RepID=A0A150XWP6_9BACT|nr:hypothetical protein AWW67_06415 [Roseivirga seohaensis]